MYKLICMSFDGDYVTERESFASVADAWKHSEDMGSRWFFYPFHFVVTESGKTVVDTCSVRLGRFRNLRVKTVAHEFAKFAALPELAQADVETFIDAMDYA